MQLSSPWNSVALPSRLLPVPEGPFTPLATHQHRVSNPGTQGRSTLLATDFLLLTFLGD